VDSCPEEDSAFIGESRDACPAERTQLTGESIIEFAVNSSHLKNKSHVILYYFYKKICYLTCVFFVVLIFIVLEQAYFTV